MPGYQQRGYGMPHLNFRQGPHRFEEIDPNGEQFRKLFIGGLSFDSNEKSLKDYFSKWGEIVDCVVMRDTVSQRSRGFGFITFKDKDSVDEVQRDRKHKVDSRDVETKRAMPRDDPNANNQVTVNKMFVGGLKEDTTEEMIRSVFSEYGTITEIEMIPDKSTGKIKGFCFVTFNDYDPVDKCVLLRRIMVNNRKVEIKKAYGKDEMNRYKNMMMSMGPGGPMPTGRGGRGDYAGGYRDFYHQGMGYHHPNGPGGMGNYNNWPGQGGPYNDHYFNHQGGNQRGYNNYGHNHNQHYNNRR